MSPARTFRSLALFLRPGSAAIFSAAARSLARFAAFTTAASLLMATAAFFASA